MYRAYLDHWEYGIDTGQEVLAPTWEQLKALMPTWGAEQKEDMGEEILNLRTKYAIKLEDRKRLGRLKDFFQRDLIRSNPGMTSVKFREALEELKRRTFGKED